MSHISFLVVDTGIRCHGTVYTTHDQLALLALTTAGPVVVRHCVKPFTFSVCTCCSDPSCQDTTEYLGCMKRSHVHAADTRSCWSIIRYLHYVKGHKAPYTGDASRIPLTIDRIMPGSHSVNFMLIGGSLCHRLCLLLAVTKRRTDIIATSGNLIRIHRKTPICRMSSRSFVTENRPHLG